MTTDPVTASDQRALEVSTLSKAILEDGLMIVQVGNIRFTESFETSVAKLEAKLVEVCLGKATKRTIKGEGVGLVDAFFDAMIRCYDTDFCSLSDIAIVDFTVNAHIDHGNHRKSDSLVTALLRVKNSEAQEYSFQCTSSSISRSSVAVVQEAITFFINAELAYTTLHRAFIDAKERGRHDLVSRFLNQMSILVHATSYEKLVTALRDHRE